MWLGSVIVACVLCLVGFVVGLTWVATAFRRAGLARLARGLGLEFAPKDHWSLSGRLSSVAPHLHGAAGEARNVIYDAHRGVYVYVFDYAYVNSRTALGHRSSLSVAAVDMPALCMPHLSIFPSRPGDDAAQARVFGSPAFSERYRVQCTNGAFADDLLDADMQESLVKSYPVEVALEGAMIVLHADRLLDPECVARLRASALEFVERMPEIVFQRYGVSDKEARAQSAAGRRGEPVWHARTRTPVPIPLGLGTGRADEHPAGAGGGLPHVLAAEASRGTRRGGSA